MVSVNGGNLSIKQGTNLCITRSGSRLGYLDESDMIVTGVDKDDENTRKASSELGVHRAIYTKTLSTAIVHSHSIHTTALSFRSDKIFPPVPIIGFGSEPVPGGFASEVAEALKTNLWCWYTGTAALPEV